MKLLRTISPKIKKQSILVFFLLFPHLRPESVVYIAPMVNKLYNAGRVVSFFALILIFLMKRKKPSPISLTVIALQLWVLLTTYLNHGDLQRAFVNMVSVVSLMLTVDSFPKRTILYPVFYNFEWMIYVNLATIILFPRGLYQQGVHNEFLDFFLGFKNAFFPYCIIAIMVAGLLYLQDRRYRQRAAALMVASFLNVFLAWSASSIVAVMVSLLMFMMLVVIRRPRILKKLNFKMLLLVYLAVDVLVCIFRIIENVPFIANFVVNVLHKSPSLTNRAIIWGLALEAIRKQPLIGYGIGEHITVYGYNWYAHNQILEMLMEGGIPCLALFLATMGIVARKLDRHRKTLIYSVMISAFSGIFVYFLAEAGVGTVFYLIYALAYRIDKLVDMKKPERILLQSRQ